MSDYENNSIEENTDNEQVVQSDTVDTDDYSIDIDTGDEQDEDENTDALDPKYLHKLEEMEKLLEGMDAFKMSAFKHLIKAFEIVYTMPKHTAAHSFNGCIALDVEPSYTSFVVDSLKKPDRTIIGAKGKVKKEFTLAYDHATSYFDDDGDYSLIAMAEKNICGRLEMTGHQLLHELTLINKQWAISDEISRINALMAPDRLTDEVRDILKKHVSKRIMNRFPALSELLGMIQYEKVADGTFLGEVNIEAADAWEKLNDELYNGVESFISRSFEVKNLVDRKCCYPIALILEEIMDALLEVKAA